MSVLKGGAVFVWDKSAAQNKIKAGLITPMNSLVQNLKLDLRSLKCLSASPLSILQDLFNGC